MPACRSLSVRPLRHNSQGGMWHSDVSGTNLCLALLKLSLSSSNRQLSTVAYSHPSLEQSRNPNSSIAEPAPLHYSNLGGSTGPRRGASVGCTVPLHLASLRDKTLRAYSRNTIKTRSQSEMDQHFSFLRPEYTINEPEIRLNVHTPQSDHFLRSYRHNTKPWTTTCLRRMPRL